MLNPIQLEALNEIERQVAKIRAADQQVIDVTGDLQLAINNAPVGAILNLMDKEFITAIKVNKTLTLQHGAIKAPPNTDNIVTVTGVGVKLSDIAVVGDLNNKNGIVAHGRAMEFDHVNISNVARVGQESHAIVMWDSVGPLTVKNSILEAGSIGFLAGGAKATVPNTIPTNLYFDNCIFTRKMEWKGKGYAVKNAFELKCARNVTVVNSILENVWADGQSGYGIVLTPSTTDDINSNQTIVENVLFQKCIIRNVGSGVNALGFTQHPEFPTQRGNNYRFLDCEWTITRTLGGHGGLVMFNWEPKDIHFINNKVAEDGDAFLRIADRKAVTGVKFEGNTINKCGTYGIFAPDGNIRGTGWETICPGGTMNGNTFTAAPTTFKTNFPANTYLP